ncbi:hypothetical protein T484DRAFT_1929402 [Baffinella frigidus]|nr:hypothetical protein T484DRAFT_1929402 [Cryptophyta sp. CCMP2293]|mmetsp:Transcript_50391/g.114753  ORF Transcript_50391/g.114753 Transcript_50391/m.114753 type:complete len:239 (+) Transcript_50391:178-894(+)
MLPVRISSALALLVVLALSSVSTAADSDVAPFGPMAPFGAPSTALGTPEDADSEGSCGCEDDFPPGAGFAWRREGYAVVHLEGGKVARTRYFFENERVTFKEVISVGDGHTYPQVGQRAMLRYTEFTSNECLPESRAENQGDLRDEDMQHSVAGAVEGLDELVMKMTVGEKAMFFASLDLGCVRALQAWLQWWLEATCSEMSDARARIFEVELVRLDGAPPPRETRPSLMPSLSSWFS